MKEMQSIKKLFYYYYYIRGLAVVRDHLIWTIGYGVPMHEVCVPHKIPHAWEKQR